MLKRAQKTMDRWIYSETQNESGGVLNMTNEEAIKALGFIRILDSPGLKEAVDMAVSALRAQHDVKCVEIEAFKPAKLGRSRWEGCERCNWNWNLEDLGAWMRGELGEIRIIGDVMPCGVSSAQTVEQIKYCPFCGRPITEEAWAEMEMRIGGSNNGT